MSRDSSRFAGAEGASVRSRRWGMGKLALLASLVPVLAAAGCGGGDGGRAASSRQGTPAGAEAGAAAQGGQGGAGSGVAAETRLPRPYSCRRDTALQFVPPVPAADTAGLGARIAAAFPGWRLSTLREMACRYPPRDGSRPEDFWGEGWDSGDAWWVWSGDFDGDGADDKLMILTNAANPARDELGVLFADGGSAVVAPLGGWMVEIRRAGATVQDVNPAATPIQLQSDAIVIDSGEKTADLFYWTGDGFSSITVAE